MKTKIELAFIIIKFLLRVAADLTNLTGKILTFSANVLIQILKGVGAVGNILSKTSERVIKEVTPKKYYNTGDENHE